MPDNGSSLLSVVGIWFYIQTLLTVSQGVMRIFLKAYGKSS